MKKLLIFTMLLLIPMVGICQKYFTKPQGNLEHIKFDGVDGEFKKSFMRAAKALDACTEKKCNLTDPVENKKAKAIVQIEKGWSWGASQSIQAQKMMSSFEKQVYKNKNNPVLAYTEIEWTFKKHPGYSYNAMVNRMKLYILSMESIEDDE